MYTNGLKDRFGSPLISKRDGDKVYAQIVANNTFTGNNTFSAGISVLPLGTTTVTGQPAYGLSVTVPNSDGSGGGLQLWGVQFMQGDEWSSNALKIVHNQLALHGTSESPTSLTFDNANVVEFKTMPDDGGAVGVTYDFQSWQWTDDSHSDKTNTAPVQILKNNAISLTEKSVLNMSESDNRYYTKTQSDDRYAEIFSDNIFHGDNSFDGSIYVIGSASFNGSVKKGGTADDNEILNRAESDVRYAQLEAENTFTANNTFEQEVQLENGATANNNINVESGNIIVNKEGVLTFSDPDGTVISSNGVSGYQYIELVPTSFTNGAIYELGLVEGSLDLSAIQFDGIEDKLVQTCEVWFRTGSTLPTITWPTGTYWIDAKNGVAPTLIANMTYRIVFRNEIIRTVASVGYCYPTPTV